MGQGMKRSLLMACILSLIMLISGCTASNQNALSSSKYVALYEEVHDVGQVVSGSVPFVGDAFPPIPFFYNRSSYCPPGGFPYPINDSLKIIFGMYTQKESIAGLVNSLNVAEIYTFPNTPEQGLTIIGVDKNGTVKMMYDNESIDLPPGSTWTAPMVPEWNETNTVIFPPPDINGHGNGTNYTYTIQYTRTSTIKNLGIIDK